MTRYLLDTNHAGAILRNDPVLAAHLNALTDAELWLCMPGIGELWFMVHNSAQIASNRAKLVAMISRLRIADFDMDASEEFGRIRAELRRSGRPIPSIDVQIAAVARRNSLVLLTADAHFAAVGSIAIENWLKP